MTHDWLTERLSEDSLNHSQVAHDRNKGTRERGLRNMGTRLVGHFAYSTNDGPPPQPALLPGKHNAAMRQAATGVRS